MLGTVLSLILSVACAQTPPEQTDEVLRSRLGRVEISEDFSEFVGVQRGGRPIQLRTVKVIEVVTLRHEEIRDLFPGRLDLSAQLLGWLKERGLRPGMTQAEVEFFREYGKTPAVTGSTPVGALDLDTRTRNLLYQNGLEQIGQVTDEALENMRRRRGVNVRYIRNIRRGFATAGFPVNPADLALIEPAATPGTCSSITEGD